jgi:microcystin-dependent protein
MVGSTFLILKFKQMGDSLLTSIILFAGNFAPKGFAFCEGQLLSIEGNYGLFSLLGNIHGGDGTVNFALPNLRTAEENLGGARYIIAIEGFFPTHA